MTRWLLTALLCAGWVCVATAERIEALREGNVAIAYDPADAETARLSMDILRHR